MAKKVLVIGQGAREHAIVWKLAQSPQVEKIYAAPGNPGMAGLAQCVDIKPLDVEALKQFALDQGVDLTVVGPEAPLMSGLGDVFREAGLKVFGPSARAAMIEGSKVFTKDLCRKYGIPTAAYGVFSNVEEATDFARQLYDQGLRAVVKADGLAAGKGVIVSRDLAEACQAIKSIMQDKEFGSAGDQIVIEECLDGEELSFFAVTDGRDFVTLLSAQDHKRVFDNDEGPNTGGMGAYVNPPVATPELQERIVREIVKPVLEAMQAEGRPYLGVLYAGLMLPAKGPQVLEFNARFGDPEAQVLIPMIKSDLYELLEAAADGNIGRARIELETGSCVCVVLASGGYPGPFAKGKPIEGLEDILPGCIVFHAGTALRDGRLVTDGGRVLSVVSRGADLRAALDLAYGQIRRISFEGMHYRRDIAHRALK